MILKGFNVSIGVKYVPQYNSFSADFSMHGDFEPGDDPLVVLSETWRKMRDMIRTQYKANRVPPDVFSDEPANPNVKMVTSGKVSVIDASGTEHVVAETKPTEAPASPVDELTEFQDFLDTTGDMGFDASMDADPVRTETMTTNKALLGAARAMSEDEFP